MSYRECRNCEEMVERGWKVETSTALCNRCGAEINCNGKKLPLDTNSTQPHFKSCGNGGAPTVTTKSQTSNSSHDSESLRTSLDELAVAVRELIRLLRDKMKTTGR